MQTAELIEMGYPPESIPQCFLTLRDIAEFSKSMEAPANYEAIFRDIIADVDGNLNDSLLGPLARKVKEARASTLDIKESWGRNTMITEPVKYNIWGKDIDPKAIDQMQMAVELPVAVGGALMPDAHLGYGLPIGGVLATQDAIIPYGVGVDIACRMKITLTNLPVSMLDDEQDKLAAALQNGTVFGVGGEWKTKKNHSVMDQDWNVTPVTKKMKDRAWQQLGTSGSGNHFVEFGLVTMNSKSSFTGQTFVALLSHSGSRGTGATVCKTYSDIAKDKLPAHYSRFKDLAWLPMHTEAGQEYWNAMNLMGEYASANHAVIHETVLALLDAKTVLTIENHHNFAWIEKHNGHDVYVHRKGATPAQKGVYGVIPGSMGTECYIVRGKGQASSINSASHGAGRAMSRTEAKKRFNWGEWKKFLADRKIHLVSAGLDEVPGAYKDINKVMAEQTDLIEVIGTFNPRVVKMSDDGTAED